MIWCGIVQGKDKDTYTKSQINPQIIPKGNNALLYLVDEQQKILLNLFFTFKEVSHG